MLTRGLKKLEGEKAAIGMQANGMASLVIDDPLQIGECFFESNIRLTKTELQEIASQLADGELRRRLGDQQLRRTMRDNQQLHRIRRAPREGQSCTSAITPRGTGAKWPSELK